MTERGAGEEVEEERQSGGAAERQLSQRARRCSRHERPPLPHEHPPASSLLLPPAGRREHIDRVARFVAEEEDSQVEEILLRLLRLTRNHERWGFLSADDPHHPYYTRKVAERRRGKRASNR